MGIIFRYCRWLLLPIGCIHWTVVWIRNRLYDSGIFPVHRLGRPVISIGNVQAGGTGKTPLVLALLEAMPELNWGVLTRGYGRRSAEPLLVAPEDQAFPPAEEAGDEPLLILQSLRRGALGIGPQRTTNARKIMTQYPTDCFLLDDGFQHRKLARDLDVCLVDVSRWPDHPFLLPFSSLRDLKGSLRRADIIVLTRCESVDNLKMQKLRENLIRRFNVTTLVSKLEPGILLAIPDDRPVGLAELQPKVISACSGIAHPQAFYDMLSSQGINVVRTLTFPDHHPFSMQDLQNIISGAEKAGSDAVICTSKDAVKLRPLLQAASSLPVPFISASVAFDQKTVRAIEKRIRALLA